MNSFMFSKRVQKSIQPLVQHLASITAEKVPEDVQVKGLQAITTLISNNQELHGSLLASVRLFPISSVLLARHWIFASLYKQKEQGLPKEQPMLCFLL